MNAVMADLNLVRPRDIAEAIAARGKHTTSRYLAGGTDLLVGLRHGLSAPDLLIDLSGIGELLEIGVSEKGARIGAGVSLAALARHPAIAAHYRALSDAAENVAGPGHRTMGTVGGNLCLDTRCIYYNQSEWWRHANGYCLKLGGEICHVAPQGQHCHAAYTGDLAAALIALDAEVEIAGIGGERRISLADLYVEDGRAHLALADDELLVAVLLPPATVRSAYSKVRARAAIDYPLAGVAVALSVSNGAIRSLRVSLTGTNSRPFLLAGTDDLVGRPVDDDALQRIDRLVQKQVQPMRTTLASAQYRRLAAAGLARRLAQTLFAELNS